MSIAKLPDELIVMITECLYYECNINAFMQTNRRFYRMSIQRLHLVAQRNLSNRAIEWAAQTDSVEDIRRLMNSGFSLDIECPRSWNAARIATEKGFIGVLCLILSELCLTFDTPLASRFLQKLLMISVRCSQVTSLQYLLQQPVSQQAIDQALCRAIRCGNVVIVRLLLTHHLATGLLQNPRFVRKIRESVAQDPEMVRVLIDNGLGPMAALSSSRDVSVIEYLLQSHFFPQKVLIRAIGTAALSSAEIAAPLLQRISIRRVILNGSSGELTDVLLGTLRTGQHFFSGVLLEKLNGQRPSSSYSIFAGRIVLAALLSQSREIVMLVFDSGVLDRLLEPLNLIRFGMSHAIKSGDNEIVDYLRSIEQVPRAHGLALLESALSVGNLELSDSLYLEYTPSLEEIEEIGQRVLHIVVKQINAEEVLDFLFERGFRLREDGTEVQILQLAATTGKAEIVQIFLKSGIKPYTSDGMPLIMLAAMSSEAGRDRVIEALPRTQDVLDNALSCVFSRLVPGLGESSYIPPLCLSRGSSMLHSRAVECLLAHGADPLAKSKEGEFLLVVAARSSTREIVKLFLGSFKDRGFPFTDIKTILWRAIGSANSHTAQILSDYYWRHVFPTE